MKIIFHNKNKVVEVYDQENLKSLVDYNYFSISATLMLLSENYPNEVLVWCHQSERENLNFSKIKALFHHQKTIISYSSDNHSYLGENLGYIEDSPFIKVNKAVRYPTWQMNSLVGAIHSSVLDKFRNKIMLDNNFDYYLNSLAKIGMPLGLFCYSEPKLLLVLPIRNECKISTYTFFKFVKQHYKTRWLFLLFLNRVIYERKFPVLPFFYAFFFKKRIGKSIDLQSIRVISTAVKMNNETIDVIIPTIGRKKYLYDVLKDLVKQTHLPKNVIIVEQNPQENSTSELDYLQNELWPFEIKHTFINRSGACNARNIALGEVESDWVFFADDDIRFNSIFIESALDHCKIFGAKSSVFSCLLKGQKNDYDKISQTSIFGAGCSIVKKEIIGNIKFDYNYEFGYGEDSDFGMQLRNIGSDVLYFPEPSILHIKAPTGGFRIKPNFAWSNEIIQPKPSPTVMLYKLSHGTKEQVLGFKTVFFIKTFQVKKFLKFAQQYNNFKKQWNVSLFWAKKMRNNTV